MLRALIGMKSRMNAPKKLKSAKYQYSGRVATPENVAYLLKQVLTAVGKFT
jgi:hypothetical protein